MASLVPASTESPAPPPVSRRQFLYSSVVAGLTGASAALANERSPTQAAPLATSPASRVDDVDDGLLPGAHPFWPSPRVTLITDHKKHRSRGSGLVIIEDRWLFFWREANIHGASDPDSVVKMAESRNGGQTLDNVRTIYREKSGITGTDIRARLMGNGRIGIFGSRRDSSDRIKGITLKPFFMFSDDRGRTWQTQVLNHLRAAMSPSFTFNEFPASVGGHDTEGFAVFCSGSGMNGVYTKDNGLTWTDRKLFDNLGGEVSVVRLGETDRWIMICRRSRGENPVYRSTNLVDWDGPHFSGKTIGENSSTILYNQGHLTWIAASRPYHYENDASRAIPVDGEIFKGLVTCTADAEAIWADPTKWPAWSILMYLPAHFDGTFVKHRAHWYMLFGAIEDPQRIASPGKKGYSQLGIMSSVAAPGAYFSACLPGWLAESIPQS
ncbi:hypothetical protein [Oleiharenicola lentus]|uniref:hypothetical protein n=1 Tax=Oleiharenicola lentus TaxID=2508720 RepID=UPI003F663DBA